METKTLKITEVFENPSNPRFIKDEKFKKLVASIKEFPEMASVREIVINKEHIILGGNMRFKAMKEAGWEEVPVRIVEWTPEQQREFVVKDNISGGEWDWDALANEYEFAELDNWGLDLPEEKNAKDKVPKITITFSTIEEMEEAMLEIAEIAHNYGGEAKIL